MNGFRKLLLVSLGVVLFASLLGAAISTSSVLTVHNQDKVEKWLADSKLYENFVVNAVEQGQAAVGAVSGADDVVSLSDTAVQEAAKTAFSQELIQQSINTVIESNYAWLRGETPTPQFTIDLTDAKQDFAEQVGAFVTTNLTSLPVCTNAQLIQMQNVDPLSMTCRPPNINPAVAGQDVTQQILDSDELLSNPILTAQTINPDPASQNDPYYEKFSQLPQAYQFSAMLPYIFAGLVLLSALVFILLYIPRKRGVRWTAILLAVSGVLLILGRFTSELATSQLESRIFNAATDGEVQKSLSSFIQQVQTASTTIQMYFGIGFLLVAIVLFLVSRTPKDISPTEPNLPSLDFEEPKQKPVAPRTRTTRPKQSPKRPTKRPPRLVQ